MARRLSATPVMPIDRIYAQVQAVSTHVAPRVTGSVFGSGLSQGSPSSTIEARGVGSQGTAPAVVDHVDPRVAAQAAGEGQSALGSSERQDQDASTGDELTEDEAAQVKELKARDAEVRAHEQAHAAAGGGHTGAPRYETKVGPDGRSYAVGGEVAVDVSVVRGDPEATLLKMRQVKRAALAPASPSSADRAVAAKASAQAAAAEREIAQKRGSPGDAPATTGQSTSDDAAGSASQRRAAQEAYSPPPPPTLGSMVSLQSCGKCGGSHPL